MSLTGILIVILAGLSYYTFCLVFKTARIQHKMLELLAYHDDILKKITGETDE